MNLSPHVLVRHTQRGLCTYCSGRTGARSVPDKPFEVKFVVVIKRGVLAVECIPKLDGVSCPITVRGVRNGDGPALIGDPASCTGAPIELPAKLLTIEELPERVS